MDRNELPVMKQPGPQLWARRGLPARSGVLVQRGLGTNLCCAEPPAGTGQRWHQAGVGTQQVQTLTMLLEIFLERLSLAGLAAPAGNAVLAGMSTALRSSSHAVCNVGSERTPNAH